MERRAQHENKRNRTTAVLVWLLAVVVLGLFLTGGLYAREYLLLFAYSKESEARRHAALRRMCCCLGSRGEGGKELVHHGASMLISIPGG